MELSDLSVLYIMDNQDKEETLYSLLCSTVNKITCTSTILEAKQQYIKRSPCLIIIDSDFENRDIIDFLIKLRSDDIKTAFIVLSKNKNNQ